MTDMKCPFCGEKIEHIEDGWCNCKNRCTGSGSIELWLQFLRTRKALEQTMDALEKEIKSGKEFAEYMRTELGRAHKMLEIAVDTLKYIRRTNPLSFHFEAIEKALEQITALEQKDK